MCGICGTIALTDGAADGAPVEGMLSALTHRGPDSGGTIVDDRAVAGIRRLRVIDLETGDQPIANEDGTVRVVFNGEIYNFRELRDGLEARGHRFRTRSDTEVLVHLWEEDGPGMLHRLNGMFALCVVDASKDEVFLARDRLGIKPLFYRVDGDRLVFASELAALVRSGGIDTAPDPSALATLYTLQYLPGEATPYRGVKKLLPGHFVHVRGGTPQVRRWYRLPERDGDDPAPGDDELRQALERAVSDRTVADVPLGMFLSGGIDSSIVLHLLSRAVREPVRTFSVGFRGEPGGGELAFARLAADRAGARHRELELTPDDVVAQLPAITEHLAEPVLDPALVPTWLLSRFARSEVTVVLTGEGADELFGGYRRYLFQSRFARLGRLPGVRRAAGAPVLERLMPARAGQALEALAETEPALNHVRWSSVVDLETRSRLFEPECIAALDDELAFRFEGYFPGGSVETAASLRADLHEWLPHNLLAKVDRASMAFSLEARVPFLDPRVVETAMALPDDRKIRGGVTKVALRDAFRESVPREILERPKRGFDLPLDDWMRGPLREMASEVITDDRLARWEGLRPGAARAMLDDHLHGRRELGLPLFNLVAMGLFLEKAYPA